MDNIETAQSAKIDTMSSIKGRALMTEIFKELRYHRQYGAFTTLVNCWKIAVFEKDLSAYLNRNITVLHPLGFFRGTGLWMEETVNRFYFSTINSFVYFGAAILLVLIGVRRFSDQISDTLIFSALGFEALMLIFMFVVMFFTPKEDFSENGNDSESATTAELLTETGEVARDLAGALIQLERINDNFLQMLNRQEDLALTLRKIADATADAVSPNPEMLETMKSTNKALMQFNETVLMLNDAAKKIRREEIEAAVKKELDRIISDRIS